MPTQHATKICKVIHLGIYMYSKLWLRYLSPLYSTDEGNYNNNNNN